MNASNDLALSILVEILETMPQRYTTQRVGALLAALGIYLALALCVLLEWHPNLAPFDESRDRTFGRQSTPAPVRFSQPTALDFGQTSSGGSGRNRPIPAQAQPLKQKQAPEAHTPKPKITPLQKPPTRSHQAKKLPEVHERLVRQAPQEPERDASSYPLAHVLRQAQDERSLADRPEEPDYEYQEQTRAQARASAASLFGGSAFSQHARSYAQAQRQAQAEGPEDFENGYGGAGYGGTGNGSGGGSGSGSGSSGQKARAIGWEFFMNKFVRSVCATSDQNPLPIPNDTVSGHTMVVNITVNRARKVTRVTIAVPSPKYYLNTYLERILSLTTIPQLPEEYPHDELTMPLRVHIKTCENLREIRLVPAYD